MREEVVFCRTTPERAEVHCHGGDAAIRRILADCNTRGAETVPWRNLAPPSLETECWQKVIDATTERTARWLLKQVEAFPQAVRELRLASPGERANRIRAILSWAPFGRHLTEPWKVVLCGQPNVGKSSLINALLGYGRAIVFDQPGTTRDVIDSETALAGWPMIFSDTAGLRESSDHLESAGIERALAAAATADLCLLVIDASQPASEVDQVLIERLEAPLVVLNKVDRQVHPDHADTSHEVRLSALTGTGIENLQNEIVRRLVPATPPENAAFPVTSAQESLLEALLAAATDDALFLSKIDTATTRPDVHPALLSTANEPGGVHARRSHQQ